MSSTGVVGMFLLLMLFYLSIFGLSIASYVMQALSLYTLADRRQIKNPWMAWIPYANYWLLGCLADDYDAGRGIKRKWRVVLLVLSLAVIAGVVILYVSIFAMVFTMAYQYDAYYYDYYYYEYEPDVMELGIMLLIYAALVPIMIASSALQICNAICIYKIYESTVPERALKYMLLSILVPLAQGICLMRCRKLGYERPKMWYYPPVPVMAGPPAQVQPAAEPVQPPVQEQTAPVEAAAEPENGRT